MTKNALTLRKARPLELKAVHALQAECARELARASGPGPWAPVSPARLLARVAAWGMPFMILEDGVLAGVFLLTHGKPRTYREAWFAAPAPALHLHSLCVRPGFQRQGLGRAAMTAIENRARDGGALSLRLDTYAGSAGAGGFYEKCGYRRMHVSSGREYYEKFLG